MLLVPTLQTLMVCAHHNELQTNMHGPLAQGTDNGIRLLFPCSPSAGLPLRQNSTPEGYWDITYGSSSCFFSKFKIMHFQICDIKLYTVVPFFLCVLNF